MRNSIFLLAALLILAPAAIASAEVEGQVEEELEELGHNMEHTGEQAHEEYQTVSHETGVDDAVPGEIDSRLEGILIAKSEDGETPVDGAETPGFAERLREAVDGPMMVAGLAGLGATALGMGGFAAVTRYISPKEALKNPQRAMLYGFIRATPGAHLKQLSEEFKMKTSSILWHIRKLESADLVHSERANGFRVFYPSEGGIEAKRLSRAITALHNHNAQAIQDAVNRSPGRTVKEISESLNVHSGTIRWHLRKLRDFGLLEELVSDDGSRFFPTPLGKNAIETTVGKPTVAGPARTGAGTAGNAVLGGE